MAKTSGRGEVYSMVVFHQPFHRGFDNHLPCTVALVELDEWVNVPGKHSWLPARGGHSGDVGSSGV
ncbi:OB-fold domain-containing protein [Chloroflexota bacterium]